MASKWIEIESPEIPAVQVAEDAIRRRVLQVQKMLPLAVHHFEEDREHVHQLRVACRRADATLKAFRPLLSKKSARLRKIIRRIRKSAGPARDIDVLLAQVQKVEGYGENTPYLIKRLTRRRSKAQQALLKVEAKLSPEKFARNIDRCFPYHDRDSGSTLPIGVFAQEALREASRPLQKLARVQNPTVEQLHELRISGKRLRYSIEIFHGVFESKLRTELYPLIENLQSRLGSMNDHATAQALFQSMLVGMSADSRAAFLARCIVEQHEAAQRVREEFLRWWTPERVALLESHLNRWA